MQCQHCGVRPADINVMMQLNNEKVKMHLCNQCFQEIQGKIMNSNGMFNQNQQDAFQENFAKSEAKRS